MAPGGARCRDVGGSPDGAAGGVSWRRAVLGRPARSRSGNVTYLAHGARRRWIGTPRDRWAQRGVCWRPAQVRRGGTHCVHAAGGQGVALLGPATRLRTRGRRTGCRIPDLAREHPAAATVLDLRRADADRERAGNERVVVLGSHACSMTGAQPRRAGRSLRACAAARYSPASGFRLLPAKRFRHPRHRHRPVRTRPRSGRTRKPRQSSRRRRPDSPVHLRRPPAHAANWSLWRAMMRLVSERAAPGLRGAGRLPRGFLLVGAGQLGGQRVRLG